MGSLIQQLKWNKSCGSIPIDYKLLIVRFDNSYLSTLVDIDLHDLVQNGKIFGTHKIPTDTDRLQLWAGNITDLKSSA